MRTSLTLAAVASIAFAGVSALAQTDAKQPFLERIRAQQSVVASAPGAADGAAWLRLAILQNDAAQFPAAERSYRKSIALLKSGDPALLATALDQLGSMYVVTGRADRAEPLEMKALALRERQNDRLGVGLSHMHLAALFVSQHQLSAAEAEAGTAVSLLVSNPASAATPEQQMTVLIHLALVRCARGHSSAAIPDLQHALTLARASYLPNSVPVGLLDFLLGYAEWKNGDTASAAAHMSTGTQELATQLGWGHPTYVQALHQYKTFLAQTGHANEAHQLEARLSSFNPAHANSSAAAPSLDLLP